MEISVLPRDGSYSPACLGSRIRAAWRTVSLIAMIIPGRLVLKCAFPSPRFVGTWWLATRGGLAARWAGLVALALVYFSLVTSAIGSPEESGVRRFSFDTLQSHDGYVPVSPDVVYAADRGYGFEPTSAGRLFSVTAPEGNYLVTVTLGGPAADGETTIRAESRRLMIESLATARGSTIDCAFVVNVRNERLPPPDQNAPGGDRVALNPRERDALHWDDKLTLEFGGRNPVVRAVVIHRVDVPTVFLVGDSTVTDQPFEPNASWGQMLPRFLKADVAVANHAESGETIKSFISSLRLAKVLSQLKGGDWVFIQFGHNDSKSQWPQTYVDAQTTYKAYLRVLVAEVGLRGATPVLVTSMHRRVFDSAGKIVNTHGGYPAAVRALAREDGVPLIDLESMSREFYEALGPKRAELAFADDGRDKTHHNNYGAYELAKCVVQGIREAHLDLAQHITDDFRGFQPGAPDAPELFDLAPSPGPTMTERPRGD